MLNYIWAGLIIASLVFALYYDGRDLYNDRFRNATPLPATITVPEDSAGADHGNATLVFDPQQYAAHFGVAARPAESYRVELTRLDEGIEVRFAADAPLPEPLATIAGETNEDAVLIAEAEGMNELAAGEHRVALDLPPVHFVKLKAITDAAIEFAKFAVTFSLGLIGTLALWLGLMRIAEVAGLISVFVHIVRPVLHPLFPQVPKDHPALGMIALNLAANVLGLGNAATPLGLKAMEELQKLNSTDDTATDPMVMLLAINTASVQLIPSATLVAVMGLSVTEVFGPIVIVTSISLAIAIVVTKLLGRLPRYRSTDPNRLAPEGGR